MLIMIYIRLGLAFAQIQKYRAPSEDRTHWQCSPNLVRYFTALAAHINYHHHVRPPARISLTLSRHFSLNHAKCDILVNEFDPQPRYNVSFLVITFVWIPLSLPVLWQGYIWHWITHKSWYTKKTNKLKPTVM